MDDLRVGSDDAATVRLRDDPPPPDPPAAPPLVPTWAGRYSLIRKLAEGGMGEVYIAYDAELDRRVAMKLLRQAAGSVTVQQRMHREAQALARLSHPNVVQVYDVGHHGEQLFVTMELVVGADLRKWWRAAPRGWRDVLAVVLQAGEGLAAAHRSGLVHRDIKPDNILVGDDGRVRVADFGLARGELGDEADAHAPVGEPRSGSLLDTPLTEQGALIGTPAYMAPEQFLRKPADVRSDVFALCVVLYEGVYGERPFRGRTWQELAAATLAGSFTPPPRDPPIPAWLARVIARGLHTDANDRQQTVDALLADLQRPLQANKRRLGWGLGLGALGLGVGLGAAVLAGKAPCADADAAAAALWTPEREAAVRAALVAVSPTAGAEVAQGLAVRIGRHVADLEDMSRTTCLAYQSGELSDNLYDRARACLDRRGGEVEALLAVLAAPDADVVAQALTAADGLRELAGCSDRAALLAQVPAPDPATAAAVPALARRIDHARTLRLAGRYPEVDPLLAPLVADADALAYAPLAAEARIERALVSLELARAPEAAEDLSRAAALAEAVGADELRLAALTAWLKAIGKSPAAPSVLAAVEPQTIALVERRELLDHRAHGLALIAAGEAWLDHDEARAAERLIAAIALFERLGDAPELPEALNDLAMVRSSQARLPEAHALYQRAREILVATLGPHHPNLGYIANNESRVFERQGDFVAARRSAAAAVDLWLPVFGADHPRTLIASLQLARTAYELGDDATASDHASRVLAARERISGRDHTSIAAPLHTLARVALRGGERSLARTHATRALAILERAYGPTSPKLADILPILAQLELADGHPDLALGYATRALALAKSDAARARLQLDLATIHWSRDDRTAAHAAATLAAAALPTETAAWLAAHPG